MCTLENVQLQNTLQMCNKKNVQLKVQNRQSSSHHEELGVSESERETDWVKAIVVVEFFNTFSDHACGVKPVVSAGSVLSDQIVIYVEL